MNVFSKKLLSIVLAVVMLVGMVPAVAFAAPVTMPAGMTSIKDVETTLAPGISQHEIVLLDQNGKQVEVFVATADLSVDTVGIQSSYVGAQCVNHGMATMTEQMMAAEAKYEARGEQYTAVVGMNCSYYNMTTGQPQGAFYMEGVDGKGSNVNGQPFFAILKDGTAIIGSAGQYQTYKDQIWEAVGGNELLVWEGKNTRTTDDGAKYPRSAIGITADGQVIFINANGNQAPKSVGLARYELAELFLQLGCVAAVKMDEGGSATYVTKPQGSDTLKVTNTPSDGAERPVSTGIIMYSTAKGDGEFNSAVLTPEHEYVTPESVVPVSAVGADVVGGAAVIPTDVVWQLKDASMGTVANGVFTSNGKTGEAVIQMIYKGQVVGQTSVYVVIPTLAFANANTVVPYGKTVPFSVEATYESREVALKDGDLTFTLSDSKLGTVSGNMFTACDASSGLTTGTVTATFKYDTAVKATTTLVFGKGSEVVADFENAKTEDFTVRTYYYDRNGGSGATGPAGRMELGDAWVVDSTTGKVRNGDKALAMNVDFSKGTAAGGYSVTLHIPPVDTTGATYVGMWIYVPVKELSKLAVYFYAKSTITAPNTPAKSATLFSYQGFKNASVTPAEDGWYYFRVPVSGFNQIAAISFSTTDSNNTIWNPYDDFVIYIDDITADFSDAVEDRENPTFSDIYLSETADSKFAMNGQTITKNTVTVEATATENTTMINATGLDLNSAKVFVDGVEITSGVTCSTDGKVIASNVALADGVHTFRFEIADKAGNVGIVTRQVVVNSKNGNVYLTPADPDAALVPLGSVLYYNLMAKNIEDVQSATVTIDLDSISHWELEGMEVAYGFTATYSINTDFNTATITITRTGDVEAEGETALAVLPVRTWEPTGWKDPYFLNLGVVSSNPGLVDSYKMMTPYGMWYSDGTRMYRVEVQVDSAVVTYVDDTVETFTSEEFRTLTEMNRYRADGHYDADWVWHKEDPTTSVKEHRQDKWSNHIHVLGTAQDKAATCTTAGYIGRIFCAGCSCGSKENIYNATADVDCKGHVGGCGSVVEWGTVIPATGHTFEVVDGVMQCACGKIFNGEMDGKTYIDGVVADGWVDAYYYVDGVKLTGANLVDGVVCVFGEDGTYDEAASAIYLGFVKDGDDLYYAQLGQLISGWQSAKNPVVDENPDDYVFVDEYVYYYFMPDTFKAFKEGTLTVDGRTYEFDNYTLVDGEWVANTYGPYLYWGGEYVSNGWKTVKGKTYYFWYGRAYIGVRQVSLTYNGVDKYLHVFDENGVHIEIMNGLYEDRYYIDGKSVPSYYGMVEYNGDYYYIKDNAKIVKDVTLTIAAAKTNGLVEAGKYSFDADGKMIIKEPEVLNGLVGDYYYIDGVKVSPYYGMVEHNGNYYYIKDNAKIVKNVTLTITAAKTNGFVKAGKYSFDADGKMIIEVPEVLNGLVGDYYYIDGVKVGSYYGLVKHGDDYYYIKDYAKIVKNVTITITAAKTNGLVEAGTYEFDADGKMIIP